LIFRLFHQLHSHLLSCLLKYIFISLSTKFKHFFQRKTHKAKFTRISTWTNQLSHCVRCHCAWQCTFCSETTLRLITWKQSLHYPTVSIVSMTLSTTTIDEKFVALIHISILFHCFVNMWTVIFLLSVLLSRAFSV
jgi:hypothetical protein